MGFREDMPKAWNKAIKRYGYICPVCGNVDYFREHWRIVKDVSCDEETGKLKYSDTIYVDDMHPQISEVECVECNSLAVICEKGVVKEVILHTDNIKHAESVTIE